MKHARAIALAFAAALATGLVQAATEDQKQMVYEAVDRNASEIALMSDSLYYFAEPGMQEVESAKLLKETFESIGFRWSSGAPACPPRMGDLGQRQAAYRRDHGDRRPPGRLADAGQHPAQAAHRGRARPHGRPQHPWRRAIGARMP